MSTNPPSFRLPYVLPEDPDSKGVHPQIAAAIRYAFAGILDLQNANKVNVGKIAAKSTTTTVQTTTAVSGGGGGGSTPTTIGDVNEQSGTSYTSQSSDFGALVLVDSASAFAYTLNSGLTVPYYFVVYNFGAGTITFTPTTGTVNGAATATMLTGQVGLVFYDGADWWIAMAVLPTTASPVASNWLNSYNAVTGAFTASQPTSADVIPASGATGSRPTVHATGQPFFDTTLGIPIWWSGTNWVNASGATV